MPKTKALGDAEELVREITNASLDAIYVKDKESRWLYANPSLERIAGKPISELLNKTDAEIYSNPEIGKTILEHDKKVMESGKAETFEEFVDLPDGRHFFISVKSPRLDEKGNVIGILGISHDITNRKKREEQLRENQQKYKALIETSSDFIWEIDPQGHYTYCSPQMETLWGLKPSEMIGKTPFDQMPLEAKKKGLEIFAGFAISQKRFSGIQFSSFDGKGNLIFIEISGVPFFDKEGKLLGFRGVTRDITEHKKTEETLKESEQLYKTIFDNRDDGFVFVELIYDEDNNACDIRFLQINLAYEQQTGTKAAKVEGKRAKEVAPDLEQEWISICGEVAKTGRNRRFESYNQRTNKWYDANYILFARGRVGILFRDVTERKNLEKQLQDKERLAAIGATAGMVGHDIRNPLQAITSDVFLAKSDLSSMPDGSAKEGIKESLEGIQSNVDYINKIVQDLQDYARPLAPAPREIDLETLCEDVLFKNGVPENINASCQVEKRAKRIVTDPEILKRILSNLVNNAIQATPDCGKIAILAYQEAGNTVITVQDTGAGIPEDVRPKLFTPLFTTKSKGQGFGLAVVKRMTEALGGTVSFESKVGEGTKFIVSLPLKKAVS